MGTPDHDQDLDERLTVSNQEKHPETRGQGVNPSTPVSTAYTRKHTEAQRETHALRPQSMDAGAKQFTHNCVGGKVPRNCEKCGASYVARYVHQERLQAYQNNDG